MTAFDTFSAKVLPPGFDDVRAQELDAIDAIRRCGTLDTQLAPTGLVWGGPRQMLDRLAEEQERAREREKTRQLALKAKWAAAREAEIKKASEQRKRKPEHLSALPSPRQWAGYTVEKRVKLSDEYGKKGYRWTGIRWVKH